VSVEDQKRKYRIDLLREIPAAVRFLSLEPLLEDLGELDLTGIHQVIVGGESGGDAERRLVRPCPVPQGYGAIGSSLDHGTDCIYCHGMGWEPKRDAIHWVTSIRDQCLSAGIPFFLKQWGGPKPKSAGAMLDGCEWRQMPEVSQ
jgi:protein gp37